MTEFSAQFTGKGK